MTEIFEVNLIIVYFLNVAFKMLQHGNISFVYIENHYFKISILVLVNILVMVLANLILKIVHLKKM